MIVAAVGLWFIAVVFLAGRGLLRPWLAALLAYPVFVGILFALEPSFRGPGGRDYLTFGAVVACVVWAIGGLASGGAWLIGKRARR
jgi:hypothetical protein